MVIAASQWSLGHPNGHTGCPGLTMGSSGMSCPHGHQIGGGGVLGGGIMAASSYPPPPPPQAMMGNGSGGMGVHSGLGPSQSSFHGPPLPNCNPCPTSANNFNSVPLPGPSRWGPRTSCPVHSPFRARLPNGGGPICSGHQVSNRLVLSINYGEGRGIFLLFSEGLGKDNNKWKISEHVFGKLLKSFPHNLIFSLFFCFSY